MQCLSFPLPGLHNCLASSISPSPTIVSALTSQGQVLLSPETKTTIFSAPATAHAFADGSFFARAHHRVVFLYSHPDLAPIQLQPLHFEIRHVAIHVQNSPSSVLVVVGGYDGAYIAHVPFTHNSSSIPVITQSNYAFNTLQGSLSLTVVYVAATSDAIAAVLMDSRVAIWSDLSAPAATLLEPQITTAQGDRVTDLKFTHSFLLIAYWSGTIACYSRCGLVINKLFVVETHPIPRDNSYLKHGPTMILQSPDQLYPGGPVILFAMAHGHLTFVKLSDGTFVTRTIKSQHRSVLIKGVCCSHHHILLWVFGAPDFITLQWPSPQKFGTMRLEKQSPCRHDNPLIRNVDPDQQKNDSSC